MVRQRTGVLSRFVRRSEAEVALVADLRARWRGCRGTSRFMMLSARDWILYSSKTESWMVILAGDVKLDLA
jgi:hypothetical protein